MHDLLIQNYWGDSQFPTSCRLTRFKKCTLW